MKELSFKDLESENYKKQWQHSSGYRGMYSTWWGGVTFDPRLMLIPIDDHMVHRGDGVFEAFRSMGTQLYDFDPHMDRLEASMRAVGLECPKTREDVADICKFLISKTGLEKALFRLYVSRGPGGFSANPFESVGAQLYIVICEFTPVEEALYQSGVKVMVSRMEQKPQPYCQIKSCNYLPNVMMKKEALENGCHYSVGVDERGFLTESSTENIFFVDQGGTLWSLQWSQVLKGTTLLRVLEFAKELVKEGVLTGVGQKGITREELQGAREVMLCGTTLEVISVDQFDGVSLNLNRPISLCLRKKLQESFLAD